MRIESFAAAALALVLAAPASAIEFMPARSADDLPNPHKGWMLWGTSYALDGGVDNFHDARIFHVYVPWREVETADQVFDWDGFEARHIDPIVADFPHATFVLRLVADYPDGPGSGISGWYTGGQLNRDYPAFLEQPPLSIPAVDYASCDGDGPGRTPDWNHPAFATQAVQLVQALAQRYDGDPRITAIQVGLLGLWGEWHQSGCDANAPEDAIKQVLSDSYAAAFDGTRLQTRYARDPDAAGVEIGFHEDYFPSFTADCDRFAPELPLCDDSGDWNLEWAMSFVTPESRDNWLLHPVSGESPFTAQQDVWITRGADITSLIRDYHLSFLGPAGKHEQSGNVAALQALERALGYDIHLDRLSLGTLESGGPFDWSIDLHNSGSAPVYHDPLLELDFVDGGGATVGSVLIDIAADTLLPGVTAVRTGESTLDAAVIPGSYSLRAILSDRIPGRPAARIQSGPRDAQGRLILGNVVVEALSESIFVDSFDG